MTDPRLTERQAAVLLASIRTGNRLLLFEPGAVHCGTERIEPVSVEDMAHLVSLGYLRKLREGRRAYAVTEAGALEGTRALERSRGA